MKQSGVIESVHRHDSNGAPLGDLAGLLVLIQAGERADILAGLNEAHDLLRGEHGQVALIELAARMFAWIEDGALEDALAVLGALPPAVADGCFNLLLSTIFPDGEPVLAELTDAALIAMSALLAVSGKGESALAILGKGAQSRPDVTFLAKAHGLRGWIFGLDAGLTALLAPLAHLGVGPLDPATHRARAREEVALGDLVKALDALLTGACLPIDAADKAGIGADLAALGVYLAAIGQSNWLGSTARVRFALAACRSLAAEAASCLAQWPQEGAFVLYGDALLGQQKAWFEAIALAPPPAYPLRGAKPHVDIVWLEITNFCNQKCTFCPDMHREEPRQWLPLDQVKTVIDQLAEHVSVGSMQLNAYGEPLLHPQIGEILSYIRQKKLPWPTFFTTHGMTLQPKKLAALSRNYPAGIAVSLHNDSQDSYARSRSAKIGDYDTLVGRLTDLLTQMVDEGAPTHVRMYQMVCNGREDPRVPPETRAAFADSAERLTRHVRKWEAIAARIAENAPSERRARAMTNSFEQIEASFLDASHDDGIHLPVLCWVDENGSEQQAFMSPRPVGTYANLLLEYDDRWTVKREVVARNRCGFTNAPSLAVFATGKLGICCLDLHSTATFGSLSDFEHIGAALNSDAARRIFAELANGVATSKGCQICLAGGEQICGPAQY